MHYNGLKEAMVLQVSDKPRGVVFEYLRSNLAMEALESVMCDVIKIRLKRRIKTRSGKGNQPLNINSCKAANFKTRITKF